MAVIAQIQGELVHLYLKYVYTHLLNTKPDEAVRQMVLPGWWLCRRSKIEKVEAARKAIDDFLEDCIDSRLAENEVQHENGLRSNTTDLLNILLEAEAEGAISRGEVKGQLLQFVFAGYDTLAPTLTYMLWEVNILVFETRLFCLEFICSSCTCSFWIDLSKS